MESENKTYMFPKEAESAMGGILMATIASAMLNSNMQGGLSESDEIFYDDLISSINLAREYKLSVADLSLCFLVPQFGKSLRQCIEDYKIEKDSTKATIDKMSSEEFSDFIKRISERGEKYGYPYPKEDFDEAINKLKEERPCLEQI